MKPHSVAIVGAAETTELGKIPDVSNIQLHADAALNALADAGLKPSDIDGVACCREEPTEIAYYLGITPKWVDGTAVGGTSFLIHVRHAAAAIASGLCSTVLITHGESGRSNVGRARAAPHASSLNGQCEIPYGVVGPPSGGTSCKPPIPASPPLPGVPVGGPSSGWSFGVTFVFCWRSVISSMPPSMFSRSLSAIFLVIVHPPWLE